MKILIEEYGGIMIFTILFSIIIPFFYKILESAALGTLI